jgi:lipopolysaccharide export system ATP-binding protein
VSKLNAQRLRKRYKTRTVVQDVSLDVGSGEVVGLLGPNGAGKTTCFYMIVGLVPVDAGSIHLDGSELTHLPIHRRARLGISYLPQENSVFRRLTVEENVQAILELQGLPPEAIEQRLVELLKDLNIAHLRKHTALSLSGGERRRLEIARALGTRPTFILLDEPFAGVDPIAVLDIQRIIRFLKERGIGVLITDHNVRETLGICDHAYIINQGAVLAFGKPQEIIYNEAVRKVYLGENFRL